MPTTRDPALRPLLALTMAVRGLRRDPASSLLAVAVLVLGLAAPATFASFLVGAVRPLPVPNGERVVRVEALLPSEGGRPLPVTRRDLEAMRGTAGLEALGGFRTFGGALVDAERAATRVAGAALTPDVFPLLGVEPVLGRWPTGDEAGTTLALAEELWHELYEGDPGVLGRTVSLAGSSLTIVGVLPAGFGFPFRQNVWTVDGPESADLPLETVGRVAEGASEEALEAELTARWSRRDALREAGEEGGVVDVEPFTGGRGESGEAVAFLGLVLVALCLLLIACANVANLLLVRATERVRALGIQAALGAGRGQLAAQLFAEALLVALAGGVLGLLFASGLVDLLERNLAAQHFGYWWMRLAVDGTVTAFTAVLVVGTALVAGTIPVLRVLRVDVQGVLKEEAGTAHVGGGSAWGRAFVTAQLALSCGALVAAGLAGRSLAGSSDFGRGLPAERILVASLELPADAPKPAVFDALVERMQGIPEASHATLALGAPGYGDLSARTEMDGERYERAEDRDIALWNAVGPGYFALTGRTLRAGRLLRSSDTRAGERVAVVNESFARIHSPERDVLGRRLRLLAAGADTTVWHTVVGVVDDLDMGVGERARTDRVYLPLAQVEATSVMALVRTAGDAAELAPALRRAMADVDPTLAVWYVRTLADAHAWIVRVPKTLAALATGGGAAGLLVAAVGLYGLLAFRVRQRRRELGVRLALGADGRRLAREVIEVAARQVLPAMAIGLALAWLAAPVLQVLLLGADARAPGTYLGVAAGFLLVALTASLVPALRAAAVDPARVLRGE